MDTFKHELQDFSVYPNGQTAYEHTYQTRQCGYVTCENTLYIRQCGRVTYEYTLYTRQCGRVTYKYTLYTRKCGCVTYEYTLYTRKCGRVTYEYTLYTRKCGRVTYENTLHNPTMFPPIRFEHRNQHARLFLHHIGILSKLLQPQLHDKLVCPSWALLLVHFPTPFILQPNALSALRKEFNR